MFALRPGSSMLVFSFENNRGKEVCSALYFRHFRLVGLTNLTMAEYVAETKESFI